MNAAEADYLIGIGVIEYVDGEFRETEFGRSLREEAEVRQLAVEDVARIFELTRQERDALHRRATVRRRQLSGDDFNGGSPH